MSSTEPRRAQPNVARARRALWVLISVAVLALGSLASALTRAPSALTGLTVAASGVLLLTATLLAARVIAALEQRRRREPA